MTSITKDSNTPKDSHQHIFRNGVDNAGRYVICECGHKVYDTPKKEIRKMVDDLKPVLSDPRMDDDYTPKDPHMQDPLQMANGGIMNRSKINEMLVNSLKRVYFNSCTDRVARENGVIPPDTNLAKVIISQIADDIESQLRTLIEEVIGEVEMTDHIKEWRCPNYGNGCYGSDTFWKSSQTVYCSDDGKKMKLFEADEPNSLEYEREELRIEQRERLDRLFGE